MHIGFYKSWVANELDAKVKERVLDIIKDHKGITKLYVTGGACSCCPSFSSGPALGWRRLRTNCVYKRRLSAGTVILGLSHTLCTGHHWIC